MLFRSHACPVHGTVPKSNAGFWKRKLRANVERDRMADSILKRLGWKVVRIWEHELKANPEKCASRIGRILGRRGRR